MIKKSDRLNIKIFLTYYFSIYSLNEYTVALNKHPQIEIEPMILIPEDKPNERASIL